MSVWLITGCSTGIGREIAEVALEQGHQVAVTARDESRVGDFVERFGAQALPLRLDVTEVVRRWQRNAALDRLRRLVVRELVVLLTRDLLAPRPTAPTGTVVLDAFEKRLDVELLVWVERRVGRQLRTHRTPPSHHDATSSQPSPAARRFAACTPPLWLSVAT